MNHSTLLAALGSISIVSLIAGCATGVPTASKFRPASIPDIAVVIDCGDCAVRPTVPELIRTNYAAAAAKAGVPVAGDTPITLTIRGYSERGLAMRSASLLAGPVAFALLKDEIRAVVVIDDKKIPLEYHYRNPLFGIETVAQKLGELSFDAAVAQ